MFRSDRLKELREEHRLGQKELAALFGVSTQRIARYEQGISQPPDEIKCKIAEYFEVSFDYLMGYSDDRNVLKSSNCIVLPPRFPDRLKPTLKKYAVYLMETEK